MAAGLFYHDVLEALTAEQKLRWLYEAWRFMADFLPPEKREAWRKLRAGEL